MRARVLACLFGMFVERYPNGGWGGKTKKKIRMWGKLKKKKKRKKKRNKELRKRNVVPSGSLIALSIYWYPPARAHDAFKYY